MKNYRAMYERYEESELHEVIEEVREAEQEVRAMMCEIADKLDEETAARLDSLFGVMARAYEKQGFAYAENIRKSHGRLRREELSRKIVGRVRYFFRVACPVLRHEKTEIL